MNTRRGMALAELCVTLAIVTVAGVMAVSFSFVAGHRVRLSQERTAAQNEITLIEDALDTWMNVVSEKGAEFTEITHGNELFASLYGEKYFISFNNGTLSGYLPDGKNITINTDRVQSLSFSALARENNADVLVFCTINYTVTSANSTQNIEHTFCCNPHVADTINGGSENE